MKKIFLLLACSITLSQSTSAQFTKLATSSAFEEPTGGNAKFLKTKDGSTLFLHFEQNGKLNLKSYDKEYKSQYSYTLPYSTTGKKGDEITAAFISGNNLVVFTKSYKGRTPTLERLVVDLNNSNHKTNNSLEQIAEFDKVTMADATAMVYGNVPMPDFFIRKDPNSDCYAVAEFNTFVSNRNERILVTHYDGNHQVVSKSFYESPNDGYKYMFFSDLFVDGDKSVYVVAKGMNTPKSGGDQNGGLFVGQLNKGATSFDMTKVDYKKAKDISNSILRYNSATERFMLLTKRKEGRKGNTNYYNVFLTTFDKNVQDFQNLDLDFSSIDKIAKTQFKKKESVKAVPQSLYINADGSYTIVLEEGVAYSSSTNTGRVSTKYFLNDIGVVKYDKNGKELSSSYIPKSQLAMAVPSELLYSFRDEMATPLWWGFQFKSFQYIDAPNSQYVLFNDIEKNQTKMKEGKGVTTIQGVGDCDGYYYKISDSGIPSGELVLNSATDKKNKNLMLFAAGYYDKAQNEYITLNVTKGKAKIIWLQPE